MGEQLLWLGQKFLQFNFYLKQNFGTPGLATFYLIGGYFLFSIFLKIIKTGFQTVLLIILPSLALSYLGSVLTIYPLLKLLPFASVIFIGINLLFLKKFS